MNYNRPVDNTDTSLRDILHKSNTMGYFHYVAIYLPTVIVSVGVVKDYRLCLTHESDPRSAFGRTPLPGRLLYNSSSSYKCVR